MSILNLYKHVITKLKSIKYWFSHKYCTFLVRLLHICYSVSPLPPQQNCLIQSNHPLQIPTEWKEGPFFNKWQWTLTGILARVKKSLISKEVCLDRTLVHFLVLNAISWTQCLQLYQTEWAHEEITFIIIL